MSTRRIHGGMSRFATLTAAGVVTIGLVITLAGCAPPADERPAPADEPKSAPAEKTEKPAEPTYTSWEIVIDDHDTHIKGGITYKVTLDLTATNPSPTKAGTYTGTAVARTESAGDVGGAQLNASAVANSSKLEFTLDSAGGTEDDPLASLTEEDTVYTGSGTIAMEAAGSGTVGMAGGSFSKSSAENITVKVEGSKVTLSVVLNGQKYTFNGTITGK